MSREEIYEKLTRIFREVFLDDSIEIGPETFTEDIEEWDSLMQVVLLSEIEKIFKIKFSAREAFGMQNVGEMVDIIISKIG